MSNPTNKSKEPEQKFALGALNYKLMTVCVLLIVCGFALMAGSANEGAEWNNAVFDTRRIVVGPLVALAGFVLMVFAIIYRKKQ